MLAFINEYRSVIHLLLHALVPLLLVLAVVPKGQQRTVFLLLMATMLVDVDHLLATPIYAPNRCSILFHPLHQVIPMVGYGLMALWPGLLWLLKRQIRKWEATMGWIGVGLLIHMLLDASDCVWMRLA